MGVDSNIYLNKEISVFSSAKDVVPLGTFKFGQWFDSVKSNPDGHGDVFMYRNARRHTAKRRLKVKVPCCTPSGVFERRNSKELSSEFTGVIVLDLDHKDNPLVDIDDVKKQISKHKSVLAIHRSLSNEGLAVYVVLSDNLSIKDYNFVRQRFEDMYAVRFDSSTSDLSRLRFLSADRNMYISDTVEPFDEEPPLDFVKRHLALDIESDNEDFKRTKKMIDDIIDVYKLDITSDYGEWYKCAIALTNFGEDGRDLFTKLSSLHPEYDYDKCNAMYGSILGKADTLKRSSYIGYLFKKKLNE